MPHDPHDHRDLCLRGGLGALGARLHRREPVTVAYLGGSITWGGNASDLERFSYRARTTAWLRGRFPAATITAVNAGIGGTASDLGAFRARHDALRHRPDLLLLEFAVNDSGRDEADTLAAFEGIVRATRRRCPAADLVIVYTLAQNHLPDYQRGVLPAAVALHEQVAEHYGVTSVHLARAVARQLRQGTLQWSEFSGDNCHPTDAGFACYTDTLTAALQLAMAAPPLDPQRPLPAPLAADPWETADLRPVRPDEATPGWRFEPQEHKGGWDCFTGLLTSDQAGAEVRLDFEGTVVGALYQLGPASGDLDVAVDDGGFTTVRVFDDYAPAFWRPHYRVLARGLPPGRHVLRLRPAATADPRATGHAVRLGYVLTR